MKRKLLVLLSLLMALLVPILVGCGDKVEKTDSLRLSDYAMTKEFAREHGKDILDVNLMGSRDNFTFVDGYYSYNTYNVNYSSSNPRLYEVEVPLDSYTSVFGCFNSDGTVIFPTRYEDGAISVDYNSGLFTAVINDEGVWKTEIVTCYGVPVLSVGVYEDLEIVPVSSNLKYTCYGSPIEYVVKYKEVIDSEVSDYKFIYLYRSDKDRAARRHNFFPCNAAEIVDESQNEVTTLSFGAIGSAKGPFSSNRGYASYMTDYEFASENHDDITTFYIRKDGVTKSFSAANMAGIVPVNNKLFYSTSEVVDADAKKGYNVVYRYLSNEREMKYNIKYFTYDLSTDKTEELDLPYYIRSIEPAFNYYIYAYDAIEIEAIHKEDGIAYVHDHDYDVTTKYYYIDGYGKVGIELPFAADDYTSVRLTENRTFFYKNSKGFIVDDKGVIVSELDGIYGINYDDGVIYTSLNGYYGAIDYEGKVVIPFVMQSISDVYNGKILTYANTLKGGERRLFSSANPDGIAYEDVINAADDEIVYNGDGYYTKATALTGGGYQIKLYLYDGTLLKTIDEADSSTLNIDDLYGDNPFIKEVIYYDLEGNTQAFIIVYNK